MFLLDWKNIVMAWIIGFAVGFPAGFYTAGRFVKADQLEAVDQAQRGTAVGIRESLKESAALDRSLDMGAAQNAQIKKLVVRRVKSQKVKHENPVTCSAWTLDVGTVGLLNSARAGTPIDAASLGDEASKAPSSITPADLVENDTEVVGMYHDLAKRHNALVDYVQSKIDEQAKVKP